MPKDLPKAYDHRQVEERIYRMWEEGGYFVPRMDPARKPFVITMPPPNVTGELHLGHAITAAVEDVMVRYHRMKGEPTLWLPGEDHAGIATQNVVERQLAREGLTRHDLGREKFLERVWDWVHKCRRRIADQHRRLGASCDWSRQRFTLDEGLSRAVRVAFVRLYRQGLVYRGEYIINWCPRCETTLSDLEVEHEEEDSSLWYVRYPLLGDGWEGPKAEWGSGHWAEGAKEFIIVATTRPETILGDTAVAVHPADERYKGLVGKTAVLPALGRRIPIIADEAVDPHFGTGAVKVTPAHDPNDYEVGLRHKLPAVNVMHPNATMNEEAGPYAGLDRFACRERLVEDLKREGLLVKVEPHRYAPGRCYRCGTLIEPRISIQWFVKIRPLAEAALAAVREGRIRIIPERFTKVYYNWLENIRDWCISRQLWWGHRIPVWYCDDCGGETVEVEDPKRCAHCGSERIHQDEDVLDTWFSSGLWPFSTLGWPEETEDFRYFYPTTVRETAYDILFFWVAREIMLGLAMTGREPFRIVYLHGLIRDEKGQKMSKSKGNVIDPVEVMDQYGTDALRFTLLTGSSPGNDLKLSMQWVEAGRNFANKLWNAARFVLANLEERPEERPWEELRSGTQWLPERWILSRQNRLIAEVTDLIEDYQFGEAGRRIHDFLWGEYCDWYIEISKTRLYGPNEEAKQMARQVLVRVLEQTLRLLHPFMPFITEEIWQHLRQAWASETARWSEALIVAPWPRADESLIDKEAEEGMELVMSVVRAIRNARAEYEVEPARRIEAIIVAEEYRELMAAQAPVLAFLARLDEEKLRILDTMPERPLQALHLVPHSGIEVHLPWAGMMDIEKERARLSRELERLKAEMARTEALLANPDFLKKAPSHLVEKERAKLEERRARRERLEERLKQLEG